MTKYFTSKTTYTRAEWRVIIQPSLNGATNMAIDEAIATHVGQGDAPPTLRFYAWQPGTLSLGRGQPAADVDRDRLAEHGWGIVRRITGGRSILHSDELTYSISAPDTEPRVSGGVVTSYRRLSAGLLAGVTRLGGEVSAREADQSARRFKGPVCFEVPSDYEITADGRKLIGSAQTRKAGYVLQHGTLPLTGDITRIVDVLRFDDEQARESARTRVRRRAITLHEALGVRISMVRAVGQMMAGFAEALNLELAEGQLTPSEQALADDLRASKYATEAWTNHL
jgi:lipoate-protein ligase A